VAAPQTAPPAQRRADTGEARGNRFLKHAVNRATTANKTQRKNKDDYYASKAKTLKIHIRRLRREIGKVKNSTDDQHWAIRYLVADTGNTWTGRQVLISVCAGRRAEEVQHLVINLTKSKLRTVPP
jgi:hypothetical protein